MTDPNSEQSRLYPSRPFVAASAAIFREDRVLVAQRAAPPLASRWSLPGGLVEPGETLAEAAAREVREEVGIAARIVAPADIVEVIRADSSGAIQHHYVIVAFAGVWLDGEARAGEATSAVRWLRLEELDSLPFTENTADAIAKAAELVGAAARSR